MCLLVREALTVGKMAYHPDFVSTELDPHKAKRQLQDELSSYCVMVEPPKTTFGKVRSAANRGNTECRDSPPRWHWRVWQIRKTYTGKVHGAVAAMRLSLSVSQLTHTLP